MSDIAAIERKILRKYRVDTMAGTNASPPHVEVTEPKERKYVHMTLSTIYNTQATVNLSLDDLHALIAVLEQARDRLEVLGGMDGLEKVAP